MRKLQLLSIVALLAMASNAFACTPVTAISGPSPAYVCPPATVTLTDATTGGTWSTGDASTVSVDPSSGVVTGITGGPATVTYTVPGGCAPVYFNINSAAITGPATYCYGSGYPITMSDAYGPGTWSSPSPYISITSGGGVVTDGGPFTGPLTTATISYVPPVSTGCLTVSTVINVDLTPTVLSLSTLPATYTYCEEDPSVAFTTTISGGVGPYTYNWWWWDGSSYNTFASNSGVITPSSTGYRVGGFMASTDNGIYYGDVVDNYGCISATYTGPTLTVNPMPTVYTLSYDCTGPGCHAPGCQLDLINSDLGIDYTLAIYYGPTITTTVGTLSSISFTTDPTATGIYYVLATDATTGCTAQMGSLSVCPTCRTANPALGVGATTQTTAPLTLLPNPNTGNFTLSGSADFMLDAQTVKAEIMDITGHLALALDVPVTDGSISQSIQLPGDIVNGMYFVKLSTGTQSQVLRLLLNR